MKMLIKRLLLNHILIVLFFIAPVYAQGSSGRNVVVSIAPQRYFVQQICGNLATVSVMVPPGANPATYEPRPAQMKLLSETRLYFAIGVPFERTWLPRFAAANPHMEIVHTDKGIDKIAMNRHVHDTGQQHIHERNSMSDPHIWLSPPLVKHQARHMLNAFENSDPAHASVYRRNFDRFTQQLDTLHKDIQEILAGARGSRFMVFHPSWGYFAHAYGLTQIPIEIEGKAPKSAQLKALIKLARDEQISVIFVQPQFSAKSAEMIAHAIGGKVVPADPLASDWARNLHNQAVQFKAALR